MSSFRFCCVILSLFISDSLAQISTPFPWPTPSLPPIFPIDEAIVDLPELGRIQGALTWTSPTGKKIYWFAGIPYADPASYTGQNRFKPSTLSTAKLDEDIFYAANPFVFCPQGDIFYYKKDTNMSDLGSVMLAHKHSQTKEGQEAFMKDPRWMGREDCLVINVNTPKIPREGDTGPLLPVLFFIHGGSFDSIWGGVFGGHRFLNRDVVLVTINYRLGLLGSLNLGVDDAPGNGMMYDVVTALQWVQRYIHHFGGDKDSVTVSGHSAGSVMATHLLTSPLVKGMNPPLFHKLIGLSGSSVSAWATSTKPMFNFKRIAEHANCLQEEPTEIANCMKTTSIEDLMTALGRWKGEEEREGRFGFDARTISVQNPATLQNTPVFIDELPLHVFQDGRQMNVPVMLGATRHDGSFVMDTTYNRFLKPNGYLDDLTKFRNEFFPILLEGLDMVDTTGGALIHSMAHTYLGPEVMSSDNFTDFIPGMIDIHSVIAFKAGAYNLVEMHSKVNPHSYYFAFDYYGFWTVDGGSEIPGGVGHIDSVFYLFQAFPLFVWPNDLMVAQRFVNYWVDFATYGNPNGPEGSIIRFPAYDPNMHTYLQIASTDKIGYNCRDSWMHNSIEIKDNLRDGWWPGPIIRPQTTIATTTTIDPPPTTPTDSSTSTTPPPATTDDNGGETTTSTAPPVTTPTDSSTMPPLTTEPNGDETTTESSDSSSTSDPTTTPSSTNSNRPMHFLLLGIACLLSVMTVTPNLLKL